MRIRHLVLSLAVLLASSAVAEENAIPGQVHYEYREKVMKSIGANIGAIGDIMKNKLPHGDNIVVHAQAIQLSSTLIPSAFTAQTPDIESESLPVIWEKWEDFVAASKVTEDAAAELVEVASSGDMAAIGGAMRKLGQSCGACHRTFRLKKD